MASSHLRQPHLMWVAGGLRHFSGFVHSESAPARRAVRKRAPACGQSAQPRSVSNIDRSFPTRAANAGSSAIVSPARSRLWITVE